MSCGCTYVKCTDEANPWRQEARGRERRLRGHGFLFCVLRCFDTSGVRRPRGAGGLLRASQFLQMTSAHLRIHLQCANSQSESRRPATPFYQTPDVWDAAPCPTSPRAGYWGRLPAQGLPQARSLASPALPCLSCRSHCEGSRPCPLPPPDRPRCPPAWLPWPCFCGSVSVKLLHSKHRPVHTSYQSRSQPPQVHR